MAQAIHSTGGHDILSNMESSATVPPESEVFTAAEYITRSTLQEMEAAIASHRCCSYDLSSPELKRVGGAGITQSVFACRTCATAKGSPVGVCEPCMLQCHAEHDVIELHEKRQFLCDCPTARSSVKCVAQPPPALGAQAPPQPFAANAGNRYGHNFKGLFCSCDREYDTQRDTMYQCFACDEWYHDLHIVGKLSPALMGTVGAFICAGCVASLPFLAVHAAYDSGTCANHSKALAEPAGGGSMRLQPWVCCLTCTEGADDGRGVCMACAARCHAGHVLTQARITEFSCDCGELTTGKGGSGCRARGCNIVVDARSTPSGDVAPGADVSAAADAAAVAAEAVSGDTLAVATATAPAPAAEPAAAAAVSSPQHRLNTPAAAAVAAVDTLAAASPLPAAWCASPSSGSSGASATAPSNPSRAPNAAMFLEDDYALVSRLCRCDACMRQYASAGVATWFLDALDEDESRSVVDPETAQAVPVLLQRMTENSQLQSASGATASASGSAVSSSSSHPASAALLAGGGEVAGGAGALPTAPSSLSTDALATKVSEALTQLQQAGFKTSYQLSQEAFTSLPRERQLDAMHEYNNLQEGIMPFLREAAEAGRVITAEDVHAWFANLTNARRVRPRMG